MSQTSLQPEEEEELVQVGKHVFSPSLKCHFNLNFPAITICMGIKRCVILGADMELKTADLRSSER